MVNVHAIQVIQPTDYGFSVGAVEIAEGQHVLITVKFDTPVDASSVMWGTNFLVTCPTCGHGSGEGIPISGGTIVVGDTMWFITSQTVDQLNCDNRLRIILTGMNQGGKNAITGLDGNPLQNTYIETSGTICPS
jgi:hypothetical protein